VLRLDLGWVQFSLGRLDDTISAMDLLAEGARTVGEVSIEAHARLLRLEARSHRGDVDIVGPEFGFELDAIQAMIEGGVDAATAARYWQNRSVRLWELADFDGSAAAMIQEIESATNSGDRRSILEANFQLGVQLLSGPAPVADGLTQFEAMLGWPGLSRLDAAEFADRLGILRAMQGRFAEARELMERSRSTLQELGAPLSLGQIYIDAAWVERLAQNLDGETEMLTRCVATLRAAGAEQSVPYALGRRALAEARRGTIDLARRDLVEAEKDVTARTLVVCCLVRGHLQLHDGDAAGATREIDQADRLSREIAKFVNLRTEALVEMAALCFGIGQRQRAIDMAGEAIQLAVAKGNVAILRRAEQALADYRKADGGASPTTAPGVRARQDRG
jgi:tetratricopeptide (TPR) repeat protein